MSTSGTVASVHFGDTYLNRFDYLATKTGSIIVPACGFDSVPSDISAHLANKTLKALGPDGSGEYLSIGDCTSGVAFKGGVSGGTIASAITAMEQVPRRFRRESMRPYSLSPFQGSRSPFFRSVYSLFIPGEKPIRGGLWIMAASNRGIVQRTFGLLQTQGAWHHFWTYVVVVLINLQASPRMLMAIISAMTSSQ